MDDLFSSRTVKESVARSRATSAALKERLQNVQTVKTVLRRQMVHAKEMEAKILAELKDEQRLIESLSTQTLERLVSPDHSYNASASPASHAVCSSEIQATPSRKEFRPAPNETSSAPGRQGEELSFPNDFTILSDERDLRSASSPTEFVVEDAVLLQALDTSLCNSSNFDFDESSTQPNNPPLGQDFGSLMSFSDSLGGDFEQWIPQSNSPPTGHNNGASVAKSQTLDISFSDATIADFDIGEDHWSMSATDRALKIAMQPQAEEPFFTNFISDNEESDRSQTSRRPPTKRSFIATPNWTIQTTMQEDGHVKATTSPQNLPASTPQSKRSRSSTRRRDSRALNSSFAASPSPSQSFTTRTKIQRNDHLFCTPACDNCQECPKCGKHISHGGNVRRHLEICLGRCMKCKIKGIWCDRGHTGNLQICNPCKVDEYPSCLFPDPMDGIWKPANRVLKPVVHKKRKVGTRHVTRSESEGTNTVALGLCGDDVGLEDGLWS